MGLEENQHCLARQLPQRISFLRQLKVNPLRPSDRGGRSSPNGKEDSLEFQGSMPPGPSRSCHTFPSQLPEPHSFPNLVLTLLGGTP